MTLGALLTLAALSTDPVGACWTRVQSGGSVSVCNHPDGTSTVCVVTRAADGCWAESRHFWPRWGR